MQSNGQFKQVDFFENAGGVNLSDSPFRVQPGQATAMQNVSYTQMGSFKKRFGHPKLNSSADAELRTVGLGLYNSNAGVKSPMRSSGGKLQALDVSAVTFTALTEDTTAAASTVYSSASTVPSVFSQFNTAVTSTLWTCGAGASTLYGAYSTTKFTKNGVPAPTVSSFTAVSVGSGGTLTAAVYRWTLVFRKLSTQALSNALAATEASVTCVGTDSATLAWTITNNDTTKYDQIYLYRSSPAGAAGFTAGALVAQLASSATGYTDTGASVSSSETVPRVNSLSLDNSELPAGTYNCMTVFKRRLVAVYGSTVCFSDINKSESWSTYQRITIPSGGEITSASIISFTSKGSGEIDEILVLHKGSELWVITGDGVLDDLGLPNWSLKFITNAGCPAQPLVISTEGFLYWINHEDVFLWDGTGKPIKCGRPIKALFEQNGDLDKTKLSLGCGAYYPKEGSAIWYLSHKVHGEQKYQLKMDLRLTMPGASSDLEGRSLDGVFLPDVTAFPVYAALAYLPSTLDSTLLLGDASGFIYNAFTAHSDAAAAFSMKCATPMLTMGNPNFKKRFHKVIVWVEEIGDWNLTLDWWTDFKSAEGVKSTRVQQISTAPSNTVALWDVAVWDEAYWDDYVAKLKPLVFELSSDEANNAEGTSLRLQFRQDGADEPLTVAGYSVIYADMAMVA